MVTRSASVAATRSKSSQRSAKAGKAKRAVRKTKSAAAPRSTQAPRAAQGKGKLAGSSDWAAREKKLTQIFGPTAPKGKVYAADGSLMTAASAARAGMCVMAFAPRPDRINWIYLS
ncbi:MAG TPA: hypothetical protein VEJ63_01865, partial [Planctomycetota bacterium]|nr:hypothetical protein [Planctomycetota bacterium]